MTVIQWQTVQDFLEKEFVEGKKHQWRDGDAIGADSQAHGTVVMLKEMGRDIKTIGYPCNIPDQRAFNEFDELEEVRKPLVRNRLMVDRSFYLLAAPFEYEEVLRGSGTWATIRYAHKSHMRHTIVWPDGTFEHNIPRP